MVVVLCGDVHTETYSAGGDTVQAQGWSFVEREQAFAELEAACGERATFELAMSRLSRARRSLRTRTTRSLQLSRVGIYTWKLKWICACA